MNEERSDQNDKHGRRFDYSRQKTCYFIGGLSEADKPAEAKEKERSRKNCRIRIERNQVVTPVVVQQPDNEVSHCCKR